MPYRNVYKRLIERPDCYQLRHGANTFVDAREFKLHHHPYHEIYIYLSGKADFFIEGSVFRLNPYDIIVVPPYTLHQPQPKKGEFFERFVINIQSEFFEKMGCTDYENVFLNRNDHRFKIPGYIVKRGIMANIVNFFKEKVDNSIPILEPVICSKIVELLYYLNTSDNFEEYDSINEITQEIITYIDENFETISNIESVTKNFFYSKNHICHLFKKHTGITITKYINIKKMENVEKLYNQGKSLTHACIESGFKSYDSFAYIYKKEFGIPPKKGFAKTMENGTKFTI